MYVKFLKDKEEYIQINDKIYVTYNDANLLKFNKDNKAIIAYILENQIIVEKLNDIFFKKANYYTFKLLQI
ncbi:MAG: hypothetical protein KatS3mg095_0495 [Candidatus Parcubacteria bacterium]|nr:MAG: hypothetical protein KatS3mg095_0495 [Candidatus Parcubacteria bacterium]